MKRKTHSASFKFRVALAAIKNEKTIVELCQEFEVASSLVHKWKKALLEEGPKVFADRAPKQAIDHRDKKIQKLYEKVGQLTIEHDFLKKNWENYQERSE